MKKLFTKTLLALALVLISGSAWGETTTLTFANANTTQTSKATVDGVEETITWTIPTDGECEDGKLNYYSLKNNSSVTFAIEDIYGTITDITAVASVKKGTLTTDVDSEAKTIKFTISGLNGNSKTSLHVTSVTATFTPYVPTPVITALNINNENNPLTSEGKKPFLGAQKIELSCPVATGHSAATIYYTTDGNEPTTSSTEYSGAFWIDASLTVKVLATRGSGSASNSQEFERYNPEVTFTPDGGTGLGYKTVEISVTNPAVTPTTTDYTVRYTTDGTVPTYDDTNLSTKTWNSSNPQPFDVLTSNPVKVLLYNEHWTYSVQSQDYTINYPEYTFNPTEEHFLMAKTVTITPNVNATDNKFYVYYTTDGNTPQSQNSQTLEYYQDTPDGFKITGTTTVNVTAVSSDDNHRWETPLTLLTTKTYTRDADPEFTFTPSQGETFAGSQTVTISATQSPTTYGYTVRYTTDGNDPTTSSDVYNFSPATAISMNATTTVKIKAFDDNGDWESEVISKTFTREVQSYTLKIKDGKECATLYLGFNAIIPADVTLYKATTITNTETEKEITLEPMTEGTYLRKNTGVVVYGTANTNYVFNEETNDSKIVDADCVDASGNLLKGTLVATYFDEGQIYFLSNGEFIQNNAGDLPANKAYLLASEVGGSGGAIGLRFGDATMIKEVVAPAEDVIFDLLGRKVENPTKGIYIINGKKVLVK